MAKRRSCRYCQSYCQRPGGGRRAQHRCITACASHMVFEVISPRQRIFYEFPCSRTTAPRTRVTRGCLCTKSQCAQEPSEARTSAIAEVHTVVKHLQETSRCSHVSALLWQCRAVCAMRHVAGRPSCTSTAASCQRRAETRRTPVELIQLIYHTTVADVKSCSQRSEIGRASGQRHAHCIEGATKILTAHVYTVYMQDACTCKMRRPVTAL